MARLVRVAEMKDVAAGAAVAVDLVALFNVEGAVHAIDDACTHAGGSLADGELEGTVVTCPLHGARFDVTSGEVLEPPVAENVRRYPVHVEEGDIKIDAS